MGIVLGIRFVSMYFKNATITLYKFKYNSAICQIKIIKVTNSNRQDIFYSYFKFLTAKRVTYAYLETTNR